MFAFPLLAQLFDDRPGHRAFAIQAIARTKYGDDRVVRRQGRATLVAEAGRQNRRSPQ